MSVDFQTLCAVSPTDPRYTDRLRPIVKFTGTATAADFYVDASEFGAEGASYPAGWFVGNSSPGVPSGTVSSDVSGLTLAAGTQILNGTTPTTDLGALVDGADFGVVSGDANFQIPLFTDGDADTGFTTLRPDNFGPVGLNPLAGWTTSGAVGSFAAGTSHTIIAPTGAVVSHVTWAGDTHWFLPAPTATIAPASLTVDEMSSSGVTGTFTGFIPGETVTANWDNGSMGDLVGSYTADTDGAVTINFSDSFTVGSYDLTATGETSGVSASGAFAVVANPAELAETGADFTPQIVAGSVFLLVGGAFVIAARHRAVAKRH